MPKKQWMRSKRCYRGILTKANIPLSNRARFVSAKNKKSPQLRGLKYDLLPVSASAC